MVCLIQTEFPFVDIPPELAELIGPADPGTRIYRAEGTQADMHAWFMAICQYVGPSVSPGGVANFGRVSRPGVYKRLKAGRLTAFCFNLVGEVTTLFGRKKEAKAMSIVYIPYSECIAWREELEARAERIKAEGKMTEKDKAAFEETGGEFTRKMHDFLLYDPKDKGNRKVVYREQLPDDGTLPDEALEPLPDESADK